MSSPDHVILEKIANELVELDSFPPRSVDDPSVWVVKVGIGGKLYQFMYDNEYVAEGVTRALQALIYEAVVRYQALVEIHPPGV